MGFGTVTGGVFEGAASPDPGVRGLCPLPLALASLLSQGCSRDADRGALLFGVRSFFSQAKLHFQKTAAL